MKNNKSFNQNLEGLRGICAIVVALTHWLEFNFFGSFKIPFYDFLMQIQFAHQAVLFFFIISGYVMGLQHINMPFNLRNVIDYLKKRFIRIYPIYLLAICISVFYSYELVSSHEIIGNLFFLQDIYVKTIPSDGVLWSLSYEVIYYLLFIVLWVFNKYSSKLYWCLALVVLLYCISGNPNTICKSILVGWIFWLSGLYIARSTNNDKPAADTPLLSYLFILFATINLQTGGLIMRFIHVSSNNINRINVTDVGFVPICILIILIITNKKIRFITWLKITTYILPALNVIVLLYLQHHILANKDWVYGIVFFGLAMALIAVKINVNILKKLNYTGKISYSIYVFHFPVALIMQFYLNKYLLGIPLFICGTLCWIAATLFLSIMTELKLQPQIKQLFYKKTV